VEISIEGTNHEEKGKGRAKEEQRKVTIKIWDDQGAEEDRKSQIRRARTRKPKEVIEKVTIKKEIIVKRAKGTRKKQQQQLKKQAVKALTEIALRK
jgi:hypothetical protein